MRSAWACTLALALLAGCAPSGHRHGGLGAVTTHATARRRLANTAADVQVGIEAHGSTVQQVQKSLSDRSRSLLDYLRSAKVERLRTEQVSIETQTQDNAAHGRHDRIVGYTGTLNVSFRAAADRLGELLSGSTAHGGDTVSQSGLVPREEEIDAARRELAAEATRTAMAQAKVVAEAAGGRLAGVHEITVDPSPIEAADTVRSDIPMAPKMVAPARPTPAPVETAAGDVEVTTSVTVIADVAR